MLSSFKKYLGISVSTSIVYLLFINPVLAQNDHARYLSYLQVFKKKISDADISYKYTFSLFSESRRDDMDEVKGVFYKAGKSYLDSSQQGITLLSGGYFFKARTQEKDAFVYNIKSVEKNMGIKDFGGMSQVVNIPDSLLMKNGKFILNEEANGITNLKYVYSGKNNPLQEVNMRIRKADTGLLELKIIIRDNNGGYMKRMTLYDFRNNFDSKIISTSKYFTVSGDKVTLLNRYRSFTLNALL